MIFAVASTAAPVRYLPSFRCRFGKVRVRDLARFTLANRTADCLVATTLEVTARCLSHDDTQDRQSGRYSWSEPMQHRGRRHAFSIVPEKLPRFSSRHESILWFFHDHNLDDGATVDPTTGACHVMQEELPCSGFGVGLCADANRRDYGPGRVFNLIL